MAARERSTQYSDFGCAFKFLIAQTRTGRVERVDILVLAGELHAQIVDEPSTHIQLRDRSGDVRLALVGAMRACLDATKRLAARSTWTFVPEVLVVYVRILHARRERMSRRPVVRDFTEQLTDAYIVRLGAGIHRHP